MTVTRHARLDPIYLSNGAMKANAKTGTSQFESTYSAVVIIRTVHQVVKQSFLRFFPPVRLIERVRKVDRTL